MIDISSFEILTNIVHETAGLINFCKIRINYLVVYRKLHPESILYIKYLPLNLYFLELPYKIKYIQKLNIYKYVKIYKQIYVIMLRFGNTA